MELPKPAVVPKEIPEYKEPFFRALGTWRLARLWWRFLIYVAFGVALGLFVVGLLAVASAFGLSLAGVV